MFVTAECLSKTSINLKVDRGFHFYNWLNVRMFKTTNFFNFNFYLYVFKK